MDFDYDFPDRSDDEDYFDDFDKDTKEECSDENPCGRCEKCLL